MIQNPGFLPDHTQNWITGSLCHARRTLKISERSVHKFLSYVADAQTNKQTKNDKNITSLVEVKNIPSQGLSHKHSQDGYRCLRVSAGCDSEESSSETFFVLRCTWFGFAISIKCATPFGLLSWQWQHSIQTQTNTKLTPSTLLQQTFQYGKCSNFQFMQNTQRGIST